MTTIFSCVLSPWDSGTGDFHPAGWYIVVLYLLTAFACAGAARSENFLLLARRREQIFWRICTGLLVLLAINKQLDLQTLMTSLARCVAMGQGWYEDRRDVQRGFIMVVAAVGILAVATTVVLLRKTFGHTGPAIVGLGLICIFVSIRAASFHHFDIVMSQTVLGLPTALALEISGPVLIFVGAIRARFSKPN